MPKYPSAQPKLLGIKYGSNIRRAYEKFEFEVKFDASYINPFDPEDIYVSASFNTPSMRNEEIPAFYHVDYEEKPEGGLRPLGEGKWLVRYRPREQGTYKFSVTIMDGEYKISEEGYEFQVQGYSSRPRFIKLNIKNPKYFALDDGSEIFFVGQNLCWHGRGGLAEYFKWMDKLASNGVNLIRVWMAPWAFGIEWDKLGYYNMREAWKLDRVVEKAEERGIYIVLCLVNHGQFSTRVNPMWNENPYNKARGGIIGKPEEFFIDPRVKSLFKKRLTYIIARWAHSPSIAAWELWNEVDLTDNYEGNVENIIEWHREMSDYIKTLDIYGRPVSTSFANIEKEGKIWSLDKINFTQAHMYMGPINGGRFIEDEVEAIIKVLNDRSSKFNKPFILAEFGVDWRWYNDPLWKLDHKGLGLHNSIWATALLGASSTSMSWWWDSYVEPYDLYGHYKALKTFLEGENLALLREKIMLNLDGVRVLGLKNDSKALIWVQNKASKWYSIVEDEIKHVENLEIILDGFKPGKYLIEHWDSFIGQIFKEQSVESDGKITLFIDRIERDFAAKIRHF
ncbi:MAG: DUF5060 domain-containing protein [Candidatus Bathyarchaeia archaeon]